MTETEAREIMGDVLLDDVRPATILDFAEWVIRQIEENDPSPLPRRVTEAMYWWMENRAKEAMKEHDD